MYKYEYKWEDLCVSHDITASGKREEAQGEEKKQREKERKEERKKKEMGSNAPLKVQAILLDATPNGRHACTIIHMFSTPFARTYYKCTDGGCALVCASRFLCARLLLTWTRRLKRRQRLLLQAGRWLAWPGPNRYSSCVPIATLHVYAAARITRFAAFIGRLLSVAGPTECT